MVVFLSAELFRQDIPGTDNGGAADGQVITESLKLCPKIQQ